MPRPIKAPGGSIASRKGVSVWKTSMRRTFAQLPSRLSARADSLLGSWAKVLRIEVFHTDTPFLLAMLPPGAFIGLGMMLAIKY